METLIGLPLEIQISLAAGYMAYVGSYMGVKRHHKQIETFFIVVMYAVTFIGALRFLTEYLKFSAAVVLSLLIVVGIGVAWRMFFRGRFYQLARKSNLSWASDDPSAWFTLYADVNNVVSQVSVELDNGQILECRDTDSFFDAPHGPCLMGPDGDFALYVTDETFADGTEVRRENTRNAFYGDLVTYIPAGNIRTITLRRKRRAKNALPAVAEACSVQSAPAHSAAP